MRGADHGRDGSTGGRRESTDEGRIRRLNRRQYLSAMGAAGVAGLAGCAGEDGGTDTTTGSLATQVSDQPGDIDDFEECVVTIVGYWLGSSEAAEDGTTTSGMTDTQTAEEDTADDEETEEEDTTEAETTEEETDDGEMDETDEDDTDEEDDDGREYFELSEPAEADLVQLQGDESQLVDDRELETAEYEFLQLDTDGVSATLNDGSEADVSVPGNAPLKFNQSFEIREDTRTVFTADFTPVKRGKTGSYLIQPVASETTVSYETITDSPTTSGNESTTSGNESASSTVTESQ